MSYTLSMSEPVYPGSAVVTVPFAVSLFSLGWCHFVMVRRSATRNAFLHLQMSVQCHAFCTWVLNLKRQGCRNGISATISTLQSFTFEHISDYKEIFGSLIPFHERSQKVDEYDLEKTDVWMPCGEAPVAHKFCIRRAMYLHVHLYKLNYSSDRYRNKMLPANIWWNPFNISEAKYGEEASHEIPCPRKEVSSFLAKQTLGYTYT
jgi:hypothetical protein